MWEWYIHMIELGSIGLSDPVPPDQLSLELRMRDMDAVLDAVGATQVALLGASDGGPMCTPYATTYPDRVSHLVLYAAWPGRVRCWCLER
jgi:pimeloyl-ACP methyl ester carboxylesterase